MHNARAGTSKRLLIVAVVALAALGGMTLVTASDDVTTNLSSEKTHVEASENITLEVVAEDVPDGVGAHATQVTVSDPSVAEIVEFEPTGDPEYGDTATVADDGSKATIDAVYGDNVLDTDDDDAVVLATVTLETGAEGDVTVEQTVDALGDGDGVSLELVDGGESDEVVVDVESEGGGEDPPSPESELSDLDLDGTELEAEDVTITEDETVEITVEVENVGDHTSEFDVDLAIGEDIEDENIDVEETETTGDLGSGDAEIMTFTGVTDGLDAANDYDVEVSTEDDNIIAEDALDVEAAVESIDITLDDSTIFVNQTTNAAVTAQLSNETEVDITDDTTTSIKSTNKTIATVDDPTITAEHLGIVIIETEYDHDDGTFKDNASFEVLPIPDVTENEDEIREQVNISDDVTPDRLETTDPVYNETADETTYGFTGATSAEEIRVQGDITESATTTLLNQTPSEVVDPGADDNTEAIVTSQLDVPHAATNKEGIMLMNVSTDTVEDLDANADDLAIVRYDDTAEEWNELDTNVEEETDDAITLRAEVPGFSLFSVTTEVAEEDDDEEEEGEDDGVSLILIVLFVTLAILTYFLYQRLQEDDASDTPDQEEGLSNDENNSS